MITKMKKLQNILYGTPERIESRRDELIEDSGSLPVFLARSLIEPSYSFRLSAFAESKKEKDGLLFVGITSMIINSAITYKIATQLGEYLGR